MPVSRSTIVALVLVCAVAAPVAAQDRPVAGRIKVSSGAAFIVRGGTQVQAQVGQMVYESDAIRTGADGKIGLTLNDDTRLSLGANSELRLDQFKFAPAESGFNLAVKFVRGAATYVSGRIAKLAPNAVKLETPAAIIGVRGTTLAINVLE